MTTKTTARPTDAEIATLMEMARRLAEPNALMVRTPGIDVCAHCEGEIEDVWIELPDASGAVETVDTGHEDGCPVTLARSVAGVAVPAATLERIAVLRREAAEAGDAAQVALCERALAARPDRALPDQVDAIHACLVAIHDARAQG